MVKLNIGSRAEVMHGKAKKTAGGLTKKQLKYNKRGKIVSIKASKSAQKSKNLIKAGYLTKKGHFGVFKKGGASANNNNNKAVYVKQQEIKFVKPNIKIGSFGAGPCTIFGMYHPEIGTLCGHIDAVTAGTEIFKSSIIDHMDLFITKANKKGIPLSNINIVFTKSGLPNNEILIAKMRAIFETKITNINILKSTNIIIDAINNTYFSIPEHKIKESFISIKMNNTLTKKLMKQSKNVVTKADIWYEKYKNIYPNDNYARPPPGNGALYFSYNKGKWMYS